MYVNIYIGAFALSLALSLARSFSFSRCLDLLLSCSFPFSPPLSRPSSDFLPLSHTLNLSTSLVASCILRANRSKRISAGSCCQHKSKVLKIFHGVPSWL